MTNHSQPTASEKTAFAASLFNNELPPGWHLSSMDYALSGTEYGVSEPGESTGDTPIVGMRDLTDGAVNFEGLATVASNGADWTQLCLREGDILLNRTNSPDLVGKIGYVREDSKAIFASYLVRLHVDRSRAVPEYVAFWLNSDVAQRALKRLSTRGVSQANINPTEFRKHCPIPLAPLPEQHRIAAILRTWDEGLNKLTTLRARKSNHLTGLAQRLLGRGGVFPESWPLEKLSGIATRIRRKSEGGTHPVMTISARSGFLMQSDKFARNMAGSSVDHYTLLKEGEFAYNKGNSLAAPYGCIYRFDRPTALVPFVYFCFALKPGFDHSFYEHLFAAGALNHQLSRLINSGVRNDGLLNLNVEDFFSCKVPVPPLDEQHRIALALSAAKDELALLDEEIHAVTSQKRGLMQKLLTGQWRVTLQEEI